MIQILQAGAMIQILQNCQHSAGLQIRAFLADLENSDTIETIQNCDGGGGTQKGYMEGFRARGTRIGVHEGFWPGVHKKCHRGTQIGVHGRFG